jgi:excisionase family DNA binding protein
MRAGGDYQEPAGCARGYCPGGDQPPLQMVPKRAAYTCTRYGYSRPMMHTDAKPLLTVDEAAAVLAVHPATVRRYVRSGDLRAIQPGGPGRTVRIAAGELTRRPYGSPPERDREC